MKKLLCLFLPLFLCCSATVQANVFRVNNNLTTDKAQKLYKTLQEPHDDSSVQPGDTLMVEGSGTVYSNMTLTKRLVLIGPGYLLTQNPQTQANSAQAVVSNITIQSTANGTILIGLTFSSTYSTDAPVVSASNVIVMRCYLPNNLVLTGSFNNIQILENFFAGSGISYSYSTDNFSGVTLKNNFIQGAINISSPIATQRSFNAVENNIFLSNVILSATTFRSNIVANKTAAVNVTSGNIQNNLVGNNQLSGNGNQTFNDTQLFIGATGNSTDGQYRLKPDSPYKTAGYNNSEPGIYGGSQPYVLSGLPPLPSIYEFNAESFGSKQNGLPVTIKVKANQ